MKIMRIVPNISTPNTAKAKEFYGDVLGLDLVMDLGWIATYASNETMAPQISIASEGGSGTNGRTS
jgi:catechol 2,3-dioxygenase-like lactoylglutathione lyase family enzyme